MGSDNREAAKQSSASITVITTLSAAYHADDTSLDPCCWVNVYGPRGETVTCNLSEGALIAPSGQNYGTGPYQPTLNQNGFAYFFVRATCPSSIDAALNLLNVQLTVSDSLGNNAYAFPTFQLYSDANPRNLKTEHFVACNNTTGAPADGVTPCCIYVQADSANWGVVRAQVTGSATIVGTENRQWRDVNLQSDGSATIMVVDTMSELVTVSLSLPQAPGTDQYPPFKIGFKRDPAQTGQAKASLV